MSVDVTDLRAFYASPLGGVARRLVGRTIDRFWGPLTGLRVMGLGYATPYLAAVRAGMRADARLHAGEPGRRELAGTGPSASALVDPLDDAAARRLDRPGAASCTPSRPSRARRELLHEVWRILTPGGRIIVVAPNRRGRLGADGHDALRPGPALQPLAAQGADAADPVLPRGMGRDPLRAAASAAASSCRPPSPGSGSASASTCPSRACTSSRRQSSSIAPSRSGRCGAPRA